MHQVDKRGGHVGVSGVSGHNVSEFMLKLLALRQVGSHSDFDSRPCSEQVHYVGDISSRTRGTTQRNGDA